jgi:hypothetical protein
MFLTLAFTLEEEDEEHGRYVEQAEPGKPPAIGTISVRKSALCEPLPSVLRMTLSFQECGQLPEARPDMTPSRAKTVDRRNLSAGDKVTVVKNRLASVGSPPEWLGQYLGKSGPVLWTTTLGAMVDLPDGATWFPYAELESEPKG